MAGLHLHRRANRSNGGVAYIGEVSQVEDLGTVALLEAETTADLKAASSTSQRSARKSALERASGLVLPPPSHGHQVILPIGQQFFHRRTSADEGTGRAPLFIGCSRMVALAREECRRTDPWRQ
jgi:hypothetical protein